MTRSFSLARLAALAIAVSLYATACSSDASTSLVPSIKPSPARHTFIPIQPPRQDPTMGPLSPIAQHIAAGLQDSVTRATIRRSLLNPRSSIPAADLQSCDDTTGAVGHLLRSGELRGAGLAKNLCTTLKAMSGAILYMDPTQLAHWDGSVIPVVTAIAHPGQRLPASIVGYRSPNVTMDLPTDGHMAGPVLVVLPLLHESRLPSRATPPPARAVFVPDPKPPTP